MSSTSKTLKRFLWCMPLRAGVIVAGTCLAVFNAVGPTLLLTVRAASGGWSNAMWPPWAKYLLMVGAYLAAVAGLFFVLVAAALTFRPTSASTTFASAAVDISRIAVFISSARAVIVPIYLFQQRSIIDNRCHTLRIIRPDRVPPKTAPGDCSSAVTNVLIAITVTLIVDAILCIAFDFVVYSFYVERVVVMHRESRSRSHPRRSTMDTNTHDDHHDFGLVAAAADATMPMSVRLGKRLTMRRTAAPATTTTFSSEASSQSSAHINPRAYHRMAHDDVPATGGADAQVPIHRQRGMQEVQPSGLRRTATAVARDQEEQRLLATVVERSKVDF